MKVTSWMRKDPELIKAENDTRRLEIEQSFARRWGPTIISSLATLCIGMMSFAGTQIVEIQANKDKKIANDQVALSMYFAHIVSQDQCSPATARSVKLIEAITENKEIEIILNNITDCVVKEAIQQQQTPTITDNSDQPRVLGPTMLFDPLTLEPEAGETPQEMLPDLIDPATEYTLGQFTAYIQAPGSKMEEAHALRTLLESLGLRVPGVDIVVHPTARNEVRFYQQADYDKFAEQLKSVGDFQFTTSVLEGDQPHGIIEFWLAE